MPQFLLLSLKYLKIGAGRIQWMGDKIGHSFLDYDYTEEDDLIVLFFFISFSVIMGGASNR